MVALGMLKSSLIERNVVLSLSIKVNMMKDFHFSDEEWNQFLQVTSACRKELKQILKERNF